MKRNIHNENISRGFTLIELLVVIAIIGLLSSIVLASLNTAKYKANDAKRRSDLHSLQVAIELYRSSHGVYPSTSDSWYAAAPAFGNVVTSDWIPGLIADKDISSLPQDPAYPQKPGGACGTTPSIYTYRSIDGTGYELLDLCPANSSVVSTAVSDPLYDPQRTTFAWKVCSGTECGQ